ncbi:Transposase [Clostridium acidisoli DSM 12555]|jgi:transposase|uniref:Transposase n=1 Tax=Clostridium acidisoli DSM 12555 TaxID=1121291 RepID=A0A1W1X4J0_9CLOT|nr:transposase [Clostridium acidisoli]SMC18733.1 Transposase [Clostridium acidisoli DSM 12555]
MKKKTYEENFKTKIIRLHLEEGRTIKSLSEKYEIHKKITCFFS